MRLLENVLSDEVLKLCETERAYKLRRPCWSLSSFAWSPGILVGISGVCASTPVGDPLRRALALSLGARLPAHEALTIQHYVWMTGAGISRHDDGDYRFGATIYLNRAWRSEDGGVFMWADDGEHALCPRFNTMVINDQRQPHWVTPVSPAAAEPRLTLQIWGH
jgi:hypothetical protein